MAAVVFSAAQRDHSKLQRPPTVPASGERHAGCRDQRASAGGICSRRDAGMQFGAAQGGPAAEPTLGGFCQLVRAVRRLFEEEASLDAGGSLIANGIFARLSLWRVRRRL